MRSTKLLAATCPQSFPPLDELIAGACQGHWHRCPRRLPEARRLPARESRLRSALPRGHRAAETHQDSAPVPRSLLFLALLVGVVEGGTGAIKGGGDEVAVDLVGDLDALVAEPAGHLGDRDAFGQGGGGVEVAQ